MLVNVGLAAASLAVGLLVVEGIARLVLSRRDEGKEGRELSRHMEYDPHLGWRHRPGARTMYRRREYATEVAFNGHGLRNPERDYEARPGTFRVLALGDSFVEGYTVPYEQTVTHVMETGVGRPAFASRCSTPVPPAYSTDQEYPYYREEVFADCRARLLLLQRRPRQPDRKLLRLAQATPRARGRTHGG